MNLSATQEQALEDIKLFLAGDKKAFILKGYAGTGKTTLLRMILGHLQKINRPFELLAPTGRAAKNLHDRLHGQFHVYPRTVHSMLYTKVDQVDEDNPERIVFNLRNDDIDSHLVTIVDEASMISHVKQEQDQLIFGSGNLLQDLLTYLKLEDVNRKLIFIGDDMQLPPVNIHESITLNPVMLATFIQGGIGYAELTEVFRQDEGSQLLKNATSIREKLVQDDYHHFPLQLDGVEISALSDQRAMEQYMQQYGKASIMIAPTNREVHSLNMYFRELRQLQLNKLENQERLVVMRNCHVQQHRLYNGEFVFVNKVGNREKVTITVNTKEGKKQQTLVFQDVFVTFYDETCQLQKKVICKILEFKLWEESATITQLEQQALRIHFEQRHEGIDRKSETYQRLLQSDLYYNALFVRFGYAITCHKAQGGEWDHVYVSLKLSKPLNCRDSFRWSYTAITRAKKTIVITHFKGQEEVNQQDVWSVLRPLLVDHLAKGNIHIVKEQPIQFGTIFTFEEGDQTYRLTLYYTGKHKVGSCVDNSHTLNSVALKTKLNLLKGRMLSDTSTLW